MALSKNTLKQEFQKFGDPEYGGFVAWPISAAEATQFWGDAFGVYIADIVVSSPATVDPVDTSATTSGCAAAFSGQLVFNPSGGSPAIVANEFANAWEAAMNSIVLVPGAKYLGTAGSEIVSILPFPNIVTGKALVLSGILAVMSSISDTNEEAMDDIATSIHDATIASISTTCTYTNPAGVPPTLPGSLGFS